MMTKIKPLILEVNNKFAVFEELVLTIYIFRDEIAKEKVDEFLSNTASLRNDLTELRESVNKLKDSETELTIINYCKNIDRLNEKLMKLNNTLLQNNYEKLHSDWHEVKHLFNGHIIKYIDRLTFISDFHPRKKARLTTLREEIIREFIDTSRSSWYVLTLTDGRSLSFEVPGPPEWEEDPITRYALARPGFLKSQSFKDCVVYVPLDIIVGINVLSFTQKKQKKLLDEDVGGPKYYNKSAEDILFQDLLETAHELGFPIDLSPQAFALGPISLKSEQIEFTEVNFTNETALYSDWGYLQRISGGINSIGVGIPFASLSAGWSKSLWFEFKKKMGEKAKALSSACLGTEAFVSGFISFFDIGEEDSTNQSPKSSCLIMEGASWVPAVISDERVDSAELLNGLNWCLTYFREDGLMFPIALWLRVNQPIRIYGEVVPVTIKVAGRDHPCYLKARAAAYVPDK